MIEFCESRHTDRLTGTRPPEFSGNSTSRNPFDPIDQRKLPPLMRVDESRILKDVLGRDSTEAKIVESLRVFQYDQSKSFLGAVSRDSLIFQRPRWGKEVAPRQHTKSVEFDSLRLLHDY